MTTQLGSYAWARATKGRLKWTESLRLITAGLAPNVVALARLWLRQGANTLVRLEDIPVPDSYAARLAFEEVMACATPAIAHHSFRTYYWGAGLARAQGIPYDEELLFVSSLLHDLGLTDQHADAGCDCFALASAHAARAAMQKAQWSAGRCDDMAHIICMHLNGHTTPADGAETFLMQQGTAYDVIGARYHDLHPSFRNAVIEKHPRHELNTAFKAAIARESALHPQSRCALIQASGLGLMIKLNPYEG